MSAAICGYAFYRIALGQPFPRGKVDYCQLAARFERLEEARIHFQRGGQVVINSPEHNAIATPIREVGLFLRRLQDHNILNSPALNLTRKGLSLFLVQFSQVHTACFAHHPGCRNPDFSFARTHIADGLSRFPSHYHSKTPNFVIRCLRAQKQRERECGENKGEYLTLSHAYLAAMQVEYRYCGVVALEPAT